MRDAGGVGGRPQAGPAALTALVALASVVVIAGADASRAADEATIAAARQEGEVVWYTTQIVSQLAEPMAAAFKRRHGIDVHYVRSGPSSIAARVAGEATGGRPRADVVDGTSTTPALRRLDLVQPWQPAGASRLPAELRDPEGYWVATNVYILTPAYNTELIRKGSEPRTLDQLLDPRWKGRMVWSSGQAASGGPGFVGAILAEKGDEKGRAWLERLARQEITGVPVSARQVLDLVIAGEHAIALQIFNNHAAISAGKGAPIAWMPIEPAMGLLSVASIVRGAPHPNAAKLFLEFLISKEGQAIFQAADYLPADPEVAPSDPRLLPGKGKLRARYFTPGEIHARLPAWTQTFRALFP